MNKMNIYFSEDSELAEYEAISKGYRTDIFVKIEDVFYNVRAYTMLRLQQDFESENEDYGYYTVDPNLILVKDANRSEIAFTIGKLYEQKYFEEIKPVEKVDISSLKRIY
ncbi:hypothetical protein [Acetivibrio mesophilus]|mgnify:CR=1 FL=1|uniref:Uncharacterized protein n=1 Tax=Acetivibrio mesophilus TaxID=2487273 RepID=A0A4Q0I0L3_9FIRM|nr:hypothetical protein [Acetivibrio mesophilus]ODM27850.1 hypothetical protein A7W90_17440 [Clostridium sp. Bc-iso-3]RXE57750.1 hypothetical protein EFD62_15965 [Acetivibrio mesophilus]